MASTPEQPHSLICSPHSIVNVLSTPHRFLMPNSHLYSESLGAAKYYLDPLALNISLNQKKRQQERRRKWKMIDKAPDPQVQLLRLQEVCADGFAVAQIWEQAKRVLESSLEETRRDLSHLRSMEEMLVSLRQGAREKVRSPTLRAERLYQKSQYGIH